MKALASCNLIAVKSFTCLPFVWCLHRSRFSPLDFEIGLLLLGKVVQLSTWPVQCLSCTPMCILQSSAAILLLCISPGGRTAVTQVLAENLCISPGKFKVNLCSLCWDRSPYNCNLSKSFQELFRFLASCCCRGVVFVFFFSPPI